MAKFVPLANGGRTIVSDEDFDAVSLHSWWVQYRNLPDGTKVAMSVVARIDGKAVLLHRFLLRPEKGLVVDHRDGRPLNNLRSNIRVCTRAENSRNRARARSNRSGIKGVWLDDKRPGRTPKWVAQIQHNGVRRTLGRFSTKGAAAAAYAKAARKLHGEFARIA